MRVAGWLILSLTSFAGAQADDIYGHWRLVIEGTDQLEFGLDNLAGRSAPALVQPSRIPRQGRALTAW